MPQDERERMDRSPSLADRLASRLQEDIAKGRYASGEKLPSEHQLAETYGISRPIVREAIGRLKHDGLVHTRQGAGVFVAAPNAANVFRLAVSDFTDRAEIEHIVELLIAVEAAASEHAAIRRTPEQLALIADQLDAMNRAIERGDPGVEEDLAFHRAIVEATGNPFFRDLSGFLDQRVRKFIRTARANTARHGGMTQLVQDEHREIFEAIAAQDAPRARIAAERHLLNAAGRLDIYLKRQLSKA